MAPSHAIWEIPPFLIESPEAVAWAMETFVELKRLVNVKDAGVSLIKYALVSRDPDALAKLGVDAAGSEFDSVHSSALLNESMLATKLVFGVYRDACVMTTPVIETGTYMKYLEKETRMLGVRYNRRSVESSRKVFHEHKDVSVIINCLEWNPHGGQRRKSGSGSKTILSSMPRG